jgi:hypothetical protein
MTVLTGKVTPSGQFIAYLARFDDQRPILGKLSNPTPRLFKLDQKSLHPPRQYDGAAKYDPDHAATRGSTRA